MSTITLLRRAKQNKNDEFYTRYEDIELELPKYKNQFIGKVVYCNCDFEESAFVKFFKDHYDDFGLKDFIYTCDDFRSDKNIELLKSADIIVTNPPFSLFREYLQTLIDYDKQFLIIAPMTALGYNMVADMFVNDTIRLGYHEVSKFNNTTKTVKCCWLTNLCVRNTKWMQLTKKYSPDLYPKYDNYDAIEVSKMRDIPMDYYGVMGVPINFILTCYNPLQFEIIGIVAPELTTTWFWDDREFKTALFKRYLIKRRN